MQKPHKNKRSAKSFENFLDALRGAAKVSAITTLSRKSRLSIQKLNEILAPQSKPKIRELWQVIEALGMRLELRGK